MLNEDKLKRLVQVSRLYYEQNKTQAEIAKQFSISRPMVSKLLTEARERGIVTIHITEATNFHEILAERLREKFRLKSAAVVPMERDEERTDGAVVASAAAVIVEQMGQGGVLGIGWGSLSGRLADYLYEFGCKALSGVVCPLIGNAAASYKSYHPGELVRIIAGKTGLSPAYLYGPAIAETESEKEIYQNTDSCRQVKELWKQLKVGVVNISNYPSSPDMATALRFGGALTRARAVGHVLSYFYDESGRLIEEENDRMLRIQLEDLRRAAHVTALCGSGVTAASARGALATGLISDLILSERLAGKLLESE